MKKEKNRGSAKRLIVILSLSLALLTVLSVFSFAWIRNYIEVNKVEVTTGKMLYSFKLYRMEGGELEQIEFFDTNTASDADASQSEATLRKNINNAKIDIDEGEEVFFVIEKYADSIDFDVAITFDNNDNPDKFTNIGQMVYYMYEDSSALSDAVAQFMQQAKENPDYESMSEAELYQLALENWVKTPGAPDENIGTKKLSNIWNTVQKTSLEGEQKYACFRMKITKDTGVSAALEGDSLPFVVNFAIAQKDGLPDDVKTDRFVVDSQPTLEEAMQKYSFGDEIYISQSFEYPGDLVFTRPCTITLVRSTLTLKGNLVFSYVYEGKFTLNTVSDGHIKIENDGKGGGGNFQIDLPNSTIDLLGANNDVAGKADIYVEKGFTANTSKKEGEGVFFKGSRICDIKVNDGEYTYLSNLKPLLINGPARISVSNRTRLGKLTANFYCRNIAIENNGYIDKIDLSGMTQQDTTMLSTPSIYINNAGTIGTVDREEGTLPSKDDGDVILLPEWSKKFDKDDKESADDNTHIIANKGSGKILAITSNNEFEYTANAIKLSKLFFSLGDKGENEAGYPDHIDYMLRTQFIDADENDNTKVVIHYEEPAQIILNEDQYKDLSSLSSLQSYVEYYASAGLIAPANKLTDVTIICYGNKALSVDDYNFIKTMTALTDLDLSDAVSTDRYVPKDAFRGMTELKNIKMSESDAVWGENIFTDTGIVEIRFPQSLTSLDNPRNKSTNAVTSQNVLDGIKYVYTSINTVDGFYLNPSVTQYLFTPDEHSYDAFRSLYDNSYWRSRIFLDNGVRQFGDFFLRYDPDTKENDPTCEFVVYTGGVELNSSKKEVPVKWVEKELNSCGFDFQRIRINGNYYRITSYDAYALFNKLSCEKDTATGNAMSLTISDDVTYIGEYAFAYGPNTNTDTTVGLGSVVIEGDPEIMGYAFAYNDALVSFSAPELTSLKGGSNLFRNNALKTVYMPKLSVVSGAKDLYECKNLEQVDIGVIEKTTANENFYESADGYTYAKFYIHTDNANDVSTYNAALAANYRYIFVKESYAKLYRVTDKYTGVTDIGENDLDALREADENGNDITDGKKPAYYYVLDGTNAHLVACLLEEINMPNGNYATPATFGNGAYPVTKIGSAAYHFTSIIAQNINISSGVDTLGDYAFDSHKTKYQKACVTFNLNDVIKAGKSAFYYMDMVRIVGNNLEEIGSNALSNNAKLAVAYLPKLSRSNASGATSTVFEKCQNLRIAYTSISKDILFDGKETRKSSYVRFINVTNVDSTITIPNLNTVINSYSTKPQSTFYRNSVNVNTNFDEIILSDYYDYTVDLPGMKATIRLPGYIFYQESDGSLTLFAISPDVVSFADFGTTGKDYTTPSNLYFENGEYTVIDNGTTAEYNVEKIGNYAYGAASFSGLDSFTVGSNVKEIGKFGLFGTRYVTSNSDEIMLKEVRHLDLANVEILGEAACRGARIYTLTANKLKILSKDAFLNNIYLQSVYLPAFEEVTGATVFSGCEALASATFGENARKFDNAMFQGAKELKKITILNPSTVVVFNKTTDKLASGYEAQIKVHVPASIYNAYLGQYSSGFGGISNFEVFGATYKDSDDITYYWNVLNESEKTAYIDYIQGTFKSDLTIPSTIEGYTIVSVKAEAMGAISGVSKVILPDGMAYLSFITSDIADTVAELQIASTNEKFNTVDGVLYTEGCKTLLIYPRAKTTNEHKFTVPSSVSEIGYRAFYGIENITELTISGAVTIRDQAFENAKISTINFTSTTASTFAGRDILLGANDKIVINVKVMPNVLIDYSVIEKFEIA